MFCIPKTLTAVDRLGRRPMCTLLRGAPWAAARRTFTSSVTWKSSWTTFSTSTMSTSAGAPEVGSAVPSVGCPPLRSSSASFLPRLGFLRGFCLFSSSASSGSTSSCRLM